MKSVNNKQISFFMRLVLVVFGVLFFLSSFILHEPEKIQAAECGTAGCCANLISGAKCQYTTNSCPGGYVDNYCPLGNNYKCCLPTTTACYKTFKSKCQTTPYGSQTCSGTYRSGYCPGPTNIKCCVVPTATPTRTPTPTQSPTPTPTPAPPTTTTPGIIFSGDGPADFGQGGPSTTGWLVGGTVFPEVFSQSSVPPATSYQYLFDKAIKAGATRVDLSSSSGSSICPDLLNCTLPANLVSGVYQATGSLNLNAYNFPINRDYVFLIDGDLRIKGNIITPNGSSVLFSSSNDVIIDRSVGAATNSFPRPVAQVQALFSANRNFIVDGINNCATGTDKMLNFEGAIVTNAGTQTTGTFKNFRNLCGSNATIPSVTIRQRLDFLLNALPILSLIKQAYQSLS